MNELELWTDNEDVAASIVKYNRDRAKQIAKGKILLAADTKCKRDRTQIERLTTENANLRAQLERQSA